MTRDRWNPARGESSRQSRARRYAGWIGMAAVLGLLVHLCRPSESGAARASVTAAVARRLGASAEVVELDWFEAHATPYGVDFEATARVSASQPGDLHATRYRVHGSGRSVRDGESFEVRELRFVRIPDVPPEPRP